MAARPPIVQKLLPPGQRFRSEIEKATGAGAAPADLLLQLTLSDASKLRRDRTILTEDLSFADGEMRYLGVKVVEGDTKASALVVPAA